MQREAIKFAASFLAPRLTSRVDQNLPHDTGRDGAEMRPIVAIRPLDAHQPQICLVHQCRGLQQVIGALPPQQCAGRALQVIDQKRDEFSGRDATLADQAQHFGHVARHGQGPQGVGRIRGFARPEPGRQYRASTFSGTRCPKRGKQIRQIGDVHDSVAVIIHAGLRAGTTAAKSGQQGCQVG